MERKKIKEDEDELEDEEIITGNELKNLSGFLDGSNDALDMHDIKQMMDKIFEDPNSDEEDFLTTNNSFNSKDPLPDDPEISELPIPISIPVSILDTKREKEREELAGYIYQKQLKTRAIKAWKQFVQKKRQFEEDRRKAVKHYYITRLKKCLSQWKSAYKVKTTIVLQVVFDKWKMYVSKRIQKKLKEEACIKKYQEKLTKWAFKGWVVYHLREKAAAMKQSLSTQHWAIVLQWKTLLYHKARKFKRNRELEAKKLYRKRLILKGVSQWMKIAMDMQDKRVNSVIQREANRAMRIYRLVARVAYHWRRLTINHRPNGVPTFKESYVPPKFPQIDIEPPFFPLRTLPQSTLQPALPITINSTRAKKILDFDPKLSMKFPTSSTDTSLDTSKDHGNYSAPTTSSQRRAPRIPTYILPTNTSQNEIHTSFISRLPPRTESSMDTKGSAPSSINTSFTKVTNYPPLSDPVKRTRPPKLDQFQAMVGKLKSYDASFESYSQLDSANRSLSGQISDKPELDPERESKEIETRLRYLTQQKQQMGMYKLEYQQLSERLALYQQTNNTEEINKINYRMQYLNEEARKYKNNAAARTQEILSHQARIEELKRM